VLERRMKNRRIEQETENRREESVGCINQDFFVMFEDAATGASSDVSWLRNDSKTFRILLSLNRIFRPAERHLNENKRDVHKEASIPLGRGLK
jgi:hypothetical protein